LNEVDGERKLPIVIGGAFEAQSIAIALEKIKPPTFDSRFEFCRTI
jgi:bifunctional DNase/RNase